MSYDATIIEVMIASPSDVIEGREVARGVCNEWNIVNARARRVHLVPVGWETHSSPDLSGRAQAIINDRVLAHCDLLVGIFWTKLGTPTGQSTSGTVEEIEEHMRAGKPVMLYFSEQPVVLDTVAPEEFARLKEFKAWAMSAGLIQTFSSIEDFRQKLTRQLPLTLQTSEHTRALLAGPDIPDLVDAFNRGLLSPDPPPLKPEAEELLRAASSSTGVIIVAEYVGGVSIEAGDQVMNDPDNPRSVAKWKAALNQLRADGLVADASHDGSAYEVTDAGYTRADDLPTK